MQTKYRNNKTLAAIYTDSVPAGIKWRDIEVLLRALGGELIEGRGSRVTIFPGEAKATFHRPHPRPDPIKERYVRSAGFCCRPACDRRA